MCIKVLQMIVHVVTIHLKYGCIILLYHFLQRCTVFIFVVSCQKKKKKARLMFQVWLIFRAKMIRHFCTAVHPHESLYNLTSSQDTRTQLFFQWGIHIWKEQFWEAQHKRKIISLFSSATLPRPIPTFTQTY